MLQRRAAHIIRQRNFNVVGLIVDHDGFIQSETDSDGMRKNS
jgi:hypothetical protein